MYYIGFVNKTGEDLHNVSAFFGGQPVARCGELVKAGYKTEGPLSLKVPLEAEVRWDQAGQSRVAKVKLTGVIPDGFPDGFRDGTLYFVILTNGIVEPQAIRLDDSAANKKLLADPERDKTYRFGFVNRTGQDLKSLSAYHAGKQVGSVADMQSRTRVDYSELIALPVPLEMEVRWIEGEAPHAVEVKLATLVPEGFAGGTVFFILESGGSVKVKAVKWGDDQGSRDAVK